ncbi:MAG: conjugative transposon protein TraM [Bacteroidales bacterium]|jgi:conjugative transposon TraM protein|nr:conjugative transposon protein TraM [Bacteroidales bacterium]
MTNNLKREWKKYAVFAGMGLLFAGAVTLILFMPSEKGEKEKQADGLNMEVPAPAPAEMAGDKEKAYEQEQYRQMQQERMKTLADFTDMVNEVKQPKEDDLSLVPESENTKASARTTGRRGSSPAPAQGSATAYRDMNRTLGAFYETPGESEQVKQVKQLKDEVDALKSRLESPPKSTGMEDQLVLMEKSYQMASRYLPAQAGVPQQDSPSEPAAKAVAAKNGKTSVVPVAGIQQQVVTALNRPVSDAEFVEAFGRERNTGFHSAETGSVSTGRRNTVRACIHDDQTVSDGLEAQRNVRIRLVEPMLAGSAVIPANTILTGLARIGERMDVVISSIEYMGRIYATEIVIFDVDGQRGIAIPPSMEVNAAKEAAAGAGSDMGTGFTFNQSAGQQIAADLGRGVIRGTSQYISKKMRVVKVHLKAGYQVLLLPKENL